MNVIEGSFAGSTGKIIVDASKYHVMRITGQTYKLPASFESIKLFNKTQRRPLGSIFFLCSTIVGIPLAILMAIFLKKVTANIGFKLNGGEMFIATCDNREWKIISKYIGAGSLDK